MTLYEKKNILLEYLTIWDNVTMSHFFWVTRVWKPSLYYQRVSSELWWSVYGIFRNTYDFMNGLVDWFEYLLAVLNANNTNLLICWSWSYHHVRGTILYCYNENVLLVELHFLSYTWCWLLTSRVQFSYDSNF